VTAHGVALVAVTLALAACSSSSKNALLPKDGGDAAVSEAGDAARDGGDAAGSDGGDARDDDADARVDADAPADASTAVCNGFVMPNPPTAGLPNPASYSVNADGTVTEKVSGLTWEATVGGTAYTQYDAAAHCAAKGGDWRLPTRLELASLVDYTIASPGPTINAIFANTPPVVYWTETIYHNNAGDAWSVGFDVGYSDYGVRNNPDLVRCVLPSAPVCVPRRYVVPATDGGAVQDVTTGLIWQQTIDGKQYTWDDAKAYCAARGAGWRVPSLTELQTIVDDVTEYPAIDLAVFPDTPHDDFWTSSPDPSGVGAAWYVDFFYGATDLDVPTRVFYVRCVN
jgi:hypothetical protein